MVGILNPIRICADFLHGISKVILVRSIENKQSVSGVSLKTQILYLITFLSRYMDLLWFWRNKFSWVLVYNTIYKIFFISITVYTVFIIAFKYGMSYHPAIDKIPLWILLLPCSVLALLACFIGSPGVSFKTYFWSFSMFLECLALVPQISMLMELGEASSFPISYMACVGTYRILYIIQWIFIGKSGGLVKWVSWFSAIGQTLMYGQFVFEWLKSRKLGRKEILPTTKSGINK